MFIYRVVKTYANCLYTFITDSNLQSLKPIIKIDNTNYNDLSYNHDIFLLGVGKFLNRICHDNNRNSSYARFKSDVLSVESLSTNNVCFNSFL